LLPGYYYRILKQPIPAAELRERDM